ncbi:hypothetical protein N184_29585 [Sinorhizobium sp. GL28]|nr:hypothetical protein N184_29585 [Sinorhizobium sp. GL28]
MPRISGPNPLLTRLFRGSINSQRRDGIVFTIRSVVQPVEHIIRRDMHDWDAAFLSCRRHHGRCQCVYFPSRQNFAFRAVYGRVSPEVDYRLKITARYILFDAVAIPKI